MWCMCPLAVTLCPIPFQLLWCHRVKWYFIGCTWSVFNWLSIYLFVHGLQVCAPVHANCCRPQPNNNRFETKSKYRTHTRRDKVWEPRSAVKWIEESTNFYMRFIFCRIFAQTDPSHQKERAFKLFESTLWCAWPNRKVYDDDELPMHLANRFHDRLKLLQLIASGRLLFAFGISETQTRRWVCQIYEFLITTILVFCWEFFFPSNWNTW